MNNQLLEAGRVVSDNFARLELRHIDNARIIVFTRGVAEALQDADRSALDTLVTPSVSGINIENLFIVNTQDQEMLHLHRQADGALSNVTKPAQKIALGITQPLLETRNPDAPPARAISKDPINNRWYYFTAIPFVADDEVIGAIVIGTSIETIMPNLKSTSLADVIIYGEDGKAVASTLQAQGEEEAIFLNTLSIPVTTYQQVAGADKLVLGENIKLGERPYSLARGKLKISNDLLGVFAVVLSSEYVVQTAAINRNLYVVIFSLAMFVVILLGFIISRRIINPLFSLVKTSQAIAGGDLAQRTGIHSKDEIGTLATTFDEMTGHLQQRTLDLVKANRNLESAYRDLERANKQLEQMDRTKVSFIHISAHELRTPLTLIQGYTYMLQQMAKENPEIEPLSKGLMEGFDRMEEVVNSMLDVSKIDSKTLQLSQTTSKLSFIIAKARKPFESALKERNLELTTEGLDKLPIISADAELLHKVFYHLIMNAIKYTPDGGHIAINGRITEGSSNSPEVEIIVCDTGIGIAKENQEVVFEKFYQTGEVLMHSSGKTKFKGGGPGLGLAIARGIVEAHGGRIWLESPGYDEKTNPGTIVYVRLPVNGQKP
ncbi:MAG: HAMP domain-containing protein [Anaerolineales bacterium]|nr:HAMP domain-containing protein [Anaerolineales bacterium]